MSGKQFRPIYNHGKNDEDSKDSCVTLAHISKCVERLKLLVGKGTENGETIFDLLCTLLYQVKHVCDKLDPDNAVLKECLDKIDSTLGDCGDSDVCKELTELKSCVEAIKEQVSCPESTCPSKTLCERIDWLVECLGCNDPDVPSIFECLEQIKASVACDPPICNLLEQIDCAIGNKKEFPDHGYPKTIIGCLVALKEAIAAQDECLLSLKSENEKQTICLETLKEVVGDPCDCGSQTETVFDCLRTLKENDTTQTGCLQSIKEEQSSCFATLKESDQLQSDCLDSLKEKTGDPTSKDDTVFTLLECIKSNQGGHEPIEECLDLIKERLGEPEPGQTVSGCVTQIKETTAKIDQCVVTVKENQSDFSECLTVLKNNDDDQSACLESLKQQGENVLDCLSELKTGENDQTICLEILKQNDINQSACLEDIKERIGPACEKNLCEKVDCAQDSLDALTEQIGNCAEDSLCQRIEVIGTGVSDVQQTQQTLCDKIGAPPANENVVSLIQDVSSCTEQLKADTGSLLQDLGTLCTKVGSPPANESVVTLVQDVSACTTALKTDLTAVGNCTTQLKNDVDVVKGCTETLKTNLSALATALADVPANIGNCGGDSLCSRISNLEQDIGGILATLGTCDMGSLCKQVMDLCTKSTNVQQGVTDLCNKIGTPVNTSITGLLTTLKECSDALKADSDVIKGCVVSIKQTVESNANDVQQNLQKLCDIQACVSIIKDRVISIDTKLTTWDNWFQNFTAQLATLCTKVEALGAKVMTIDNNVDSIDTQVGQICTKVENLDGKLTGVSNTVNSVDTQVGQLCTKIEGVASDVTGIEHKVCNIQSELNGVCTKVQGVASDVSNVENKVCSIESKVESICDQQQADSVCLKDLKSEIASMKAKLSTQQAQTTNALIGIQGQLRDLAVKLAECCCGDKKPCCSKSCAPAPSCPEKKDDCLRGCGTACCGFGLKPSGLEIHKNVTRVSHTPEGVRLAFLLTICNTTLEKTFSQVQIKDPIACVGQNPQLLRDDLLLTTEVCFIEQLQQCQDAQNNYDPSSTPLGTTWQLNDEFSINPTDPQAPRSICIFEDTEAGRLSIVPGDTIHITFGVLIKNCGLKCLTNVLSVTGEAPEGVAFPCFSICETINTDKCAQPSHYGSSCSSAGCGY